MVMMKNMSEVSTVTLNRRVSNTKDTLVMMMALLAMLDLVVLLLMLATTQNKTISDGGITVDFSIIKVHTSN